MTGEIQLPESVEGAGSGVGSDIATRADAFLAELDAASDEHAASLRPANTIRSYAGDWKAWVEFMPVLNAARAKRGESPVPETTVSRGVLRAFVAWLWDKGAASTTIDRRLAGVVVTLRTEHRVEVNQADVKAARELLKDYVRRASEERSAPRGRGAAAPLLIKDLKKISAACPKGKDGEDTLTGKRDRALVLMAFATAGRRSEVAGLTVRDIVEAEDNGLLVSVRVSKTKPRQIAVPYGSSPLTCPVRAWRAWLAAAGLGEGDAAFQRIDRHGNLCGPLSGQAAGEILTRASERANVKVRLTGHSARAGLVTEARKAGKDRTAISATTGHVPNSAVLDRYIRSVDQWDDDDNALIGIGL